MSAPAVPVELSQALEIAKAAYHEAMVRAGMLRGKVEEVHAYAEANLADLEQDQDAPERPD